MKTVTVNKRRSSLEARRGAPARRGAAPAGTPRRGVPVDPRIRRRQIDVRRADGRRRLCVLSAAFCAVVLFGVGWGSTRTPLFDVDRIVIEGARNTSEAEVRFAAGINPGQAMTGVDGSGAARRLAGLTWVLRADVRREWPGTVRIRLVERIATVATRDAAGGWALVDRAGRVLDRATAPPPGMAMVDGVPPAGTPGTQMAPEAADALETASQLPPGLAPRVALVVAGPRGVELRLHPQGIVVIGAAQGAADKLRAAHAVLATVDGRTVSTLDVRVPTTPVLTRL